MPKADIDLVRGELLKGNRKKDWVASELKHIVHLHNKHRNDPSTATLTCEALQILVQHDVPYGALALADDAGVALVKKVLKDHPTRSDIVKSALLSVRQALKVPEPDQQEVRRLLEKNNMESMCLKVKDTVPISAHCFLRPWGAHECCLTYVNLLFGFFPQVRFDWSQSSKSQHTRHTQWHPQA